MASNYVPPSKELFIRGKDVEAERIGSVEAGKIDGVITLKAMMASDKMVMIESFREAGVIDPAHKHDDHETMCYLRSGKLRLWIGDETYIAEPGDYWCHPVGVMHQAEALEDSVQIEVKMPPVKTWVTSE